MTKNHALIILVLLVLLLGVGLLRPESAVTSPNGVLTGAQTLTLATLTMHDADHYKKRALAWPFGAEIYMVTWWESQWCVEIPDGFDTRPEFIGTTTTVTFPPLQLCETILDLDKYHVKVEEKAWFTDEGKLREVMIRDAWRRAQALGKARLDEPSLKQLAAFNAAQAVRSIWALSDALPVEHLVVIFEELSPAIALDLQSLDNIDNELARLDRIKADSSGLTIEDLRVLKMLTELAK